MLLLMLKHLLHFQKELNKRLDDFKRLVAEKDKIIQTLKGSQTRTDEVKKTYFSRSKANFFTLPITLGSEIFSSCL